MSSEQSSDYSKAVEEAKCGNAEAFARLVHCDYHLVYFVAYAWAEEADAAFDITQETFVRAFLSLKDLENGESFSAWVTAIARNLGKNAKRSHFRRARALDNLLIEAGRMEEQRQDQNFSPMRSAVSKEETERLRLAVLRLEPELREIVLLHYGDELSQTEIGKRLGMPAYTVSRRLDTAYNALREILNGNSIPSLASLKPESSSIGKITAMIAAIAGMSASAKAGLVRELDSLGGVSTVKDIDSSDKVAVNRQTGDGVPVTDLIGGILGGGIGKLILACTLICIVAVGAVSLTGFSDWNWNRWQNNRGSRWTEKNLTSRNSSSTHPSKLSDQNLPISKSVKSKNAVSDRNDSILTTSMVLIYGTIKHDIAGLPTSGTLKLFHDGETLDGDVQNNVLLRSIVLPADGKFSFHVRSGSGLRLEYDGPIKAIRKVELYNYGFGKEILPRFSRYQADLVIPKVKSVSGRVVWEGTENGIADAKVGFAKYSEKYNSWSFPENLTITHADGSFSINVLKTNASSVFASAENAVQNSWDLDKLSPTGNVLKLSKGKSGFNGQLIDGITQNPISHARLYFSEVGSDKNTFIDQAYLQVPESLNTDSDGKFQLPRFTTGTITIRGEDERGTAIYPYNKRGLHWSITKDSQETTNTVLTGFSGVTIAGQVLDRDTNEPIAGAKVFPINKDHEPSAVTDNMGRFRLEKVPEICNRFHTYLAVDKPGFVLADSNDSVTPYFEEETLAKSFSDENKSNIDKKYLIFSKPVNSKLISFSDIKQDEIQTVLHLAPSKKIVGTVKSPLGMPVKNAGVTWKTLTGSWAASTDSHGNYQISVPEYSKGDVEVIAAGFAKYRQQNLNVTGDNFHHDIQLSPEIRVTGNLLYKDGSPVGSGWIQFVESSKQRNDEPHTGQVSKGFFELRNMPPASYTVHYSPHNEKESSRTIELSYSDNPLALELTLPYLKARKFKMQFIDSNENVITDRINTREQGAVTINMFYKINMGYKAQYEAIVNSDIKDFLLKVDHPRFVSDYKIVLPKDGEDIIVKLKDKNDLIRINLKVYGLEGNELPNGAYFVTNKASIAGSKLNPGEYEVSKSTPPSVIFLVSSGCVDQTIPIPVKDLKDGDTCKIYAKPGASVTGRVVGDGKPLANVPVNFSYRNFDKKQTMVFTDSNGIFRFPNVTMLDANLSIQGPDGFGNYDWLRKETELTDWNLGDIELKRL